MLFHLIRGKVNPNIILRHKALDGTFVFSFNVISCLIVFFYKATERLKEGPFDKLVTKNLYKANIDKYDLLAPTGALIVMMC